MLSSLRSFVGSTLFWRGRYGLTRGAKVTRQLKYGDYTRRTFAVNLPDYRFPIWLRGGTVDVQTFLQIFGVMEYDILNTEQGRALRHRYRSLITNGIQPLIIDCGANIGLSCVYFAKTFPDARIIGIEPDQGNIEIATKNVSPYRNIQLLRGAVWDTDRHLAIVNPDADSWTYRVEETVGGDTPAYTIDQISEGKPILIAKIDIEGAEQALFRSNTDWIGKTRMIAIELHDWMLPGAGTSRNFLRAISPHPCEVLQKGENLFFFIADSPRP